MPVGGPPPEPPEPPEPVDDEDELASALELLAPPAELDEPPADEELAEDEVPVVEDPDVDAELDPLEAEVLSVALVVVSSPSRQEAAEITTSAAATRALRRFDRIRSQSLTPRQRTLVIVSVRTRVPTRTSHSSPSRLPIRARPSGEAGVTTWTVPSASVAPPLPGAR